MKHTITVYHKGKGITILPETARLYKLRNGQDVKNQSTFLSILHFDSILSIDVIKKLKAELGIERGQA